MTANPASDIPFSSFFETGHEEEFSPFLKPSSRRWGVNLSLKASFVALGCLILAFLSLYFNYSEPLAYLLLLFVYFFAGIPALIESVEDLASLQVNIDVLMTLAAFGSVAIGSPLEGGLLLVLFAISGAMEEMVSYKATASIRSLHKLAPTKASLLNAEGVAIERALAEVEKGDKILVKAGQVVPLDGKVLEGTSSVNLVHLTGENLPLTKKPGDQVAAGALNLEGALVIEVTHTIHDSTLARIIRLVTEAQEAKPKLQQWFDRVSKTYASTIISLFILFTLMMPWLLGIPLLGQGGSLYRSLAFLIAASPCALIIAIPIAYLSAIGSAARNGIVLKGGVILDALASCKAIAFDKTGTLTTGELECIAFEAITDQPLPKEEALEVAYSMEQNALHPMAQSIVKMIHAKGLRPRPLTSFRSIPGFGIEGSYLSHNKQIPVAIGNPEFITPKLPEVTQKELENRVQAVKSRGELLACMWIGETLFLFCFQDTIRKGVKTTLMHLKEMGYKLLMITGDHVASAHKVAQALDIDEVHASLKPEDKLRIVSENALQRGLAMVGDGVNDAPALARATVGISMGKVGSAAAIEAADVVLLQDNIERLDWLMKKAIKTEWIVKENLILATLAIIGASLPALAGLVPLWLAVVLHEGGTVLVGLNGLRLLRR